MKNDLLNRAVRLYGRCILTTVMGAFMYVSVGVITHALTQDSETLSAGASFVMNLVALIIQGFLFCAIIYAEVWTQGDKDGAKVQFGGAPSGDPHLGLKQGLLASIPAFLAFVLLIVEKVVGFWPQYIMVYRAVNLALYPVLVWSMGTRWDIPAADISWGGIILSLIPTLAISLVSWVSYYVGYRQISFAKKLMYKKK